MAQFRANLEATFRKVVADCGGTYEEKHLQDSLNSSILFAGVYGAYNSCDIGSSERAAALARTAIATDRVNETYEEYRAKAWAAVERQARLLDRAPSGATVAEVELVAKIMAQVAWEMLSIRGAESAFVEHWRVTRDEFDLHHVFLNFLVPIVIEGVTASILREYPWAKSTCAIANPEDLGRQVRMKLDKALELAPLYSTADEKRFVNYVYGALLKGTQPELDFVQPRGWWQYLLSMDMELDHNLAYFETFQTNVLPTQDEAQYLVARYFNTTHSLATEDRLVDMGWQMVYGLPWEQNQVRARLALSLEKMPWTFAAVECAPSGL